MFFRFTTPEDISMIDYVITIKLGNKIVQQQRLQMPPEMVMHQFYAMYQQIAEDPQPLKLSAEFIDDIWVRATQL